MSIRTNHVEPKAGTFGELADALAEHLIAVCCVLGRGATGELNLIVEKQA